MLSGVKRSETSHRRGARQEINEDIDDPDDDDNYGTAAAAAAAAAAGGGGGGFFFACEDFWGMFVNLKWRSARVHQFHFFSSLF